MRAGLAIFCALLAGTAAAQVDKTFSIALSPLSEIDVVEAQKVVDGIMTILADNSKGGVVCDGVSFTVNPTITRGTFPDRIDSPGKLNALLNDARHNVYLVQTLRYCSSAQSFGGCSGSGKSVVVVFNKPVPGASANKAVDKDFVIWLHEAIHSHGILRHTKMPDGLMNASPGGKFSALNSAACNALKTTNPVFDAPIGLAAVSPPAASSTAPSVFSAPAAAGAATVPVPETEPDAVLATADPATEGASPPPQSPTEALLAAYWSGGLPYDELQALPDGALDEIRQILVDPVRSMLWPNAVKALGALGDASDAFFLRAFFTRTARSSNEFALAARLEVALSMGVLAARTKSQDAVAFLQSRVNPIVSVGELGMLGDAKAKFFAEQIAGDALIGLALSGKLDTLTAPDGASAFSAPGTWENKVGFWTGTETLTPAPGIDPDLYEHLQSLQKEVEQSGIEQYLQHKH